MLDKLNEKYEKEAKSITELLNELNAEGRLTAKGVIEFLGYALDIVDKNDE